MGFPFNVIKGWHYNLQSAMMIASCVVFIIGAIMSKVSYAEYPNSIFDDSSEGRPISGSSFGASGGGGRQYNGGGGARPAVGNSFGGGQRPGSGFWPPYTQCANLGRLGRLEKAI